VGSDDTGGGCEVGCVAPLMCPLLLCFCILFPGPTRPFSCLELCWFAAGPCGRLLAAERPIRPLLTQTFPEPAQSCRAHSVWWRSQTQCRKVAKMKGLLGGRQLFYSRVCGRCREVSPLSVARFAGRECWSIWRVGRYGPLLNIQRLFESLVRFSNRCLSSAQRSGGRLNAESAREK
jgi:hypothetical protein